MSDLIHLADHVKTKINLKTFLEEDLGETFNSSNKCLCPFHAEKTPSFTVSQNEDGAWRYYCFGCHASGTIIDYFLDAKGSPSFTSAVKDICDTFGIKNVDELILEGIINEHKTYDFGRKLDNLNIIVSNQCRNLLRKDCQENIGWVKSAYVRLNEALRDGDELMVENIGAEASERLYGQS